MNDGGKKNLPHPFGSYSTSGADIFSISPPRSNLTPSQLVGIHQHRNWSSLDDRWSSVCSETLSAEACQVGEEALVHMDDFFCQQPFRKWIASEEISSENGWSVN
ncbi:uncharacterized protein NPIL_178671 [Nephila pilipes]|uniref:Uncharacterized protein n=1 Tax=Nephila pilipes TaxID=299642 RepID=A0A8X6N554_NEPPI|nr:uncharacterized protein NPIL_178671 [Nephila pilipes]